MGAMKHLQILHWHEVNPTFFVAKGDREREREKKNKKYAAGDPLVNVYIAMENRNCSLVNQLFRWPFSIAFCMFTRLGKWSATLQARDMQMRIFVPGTWLHWRKF